MTGREISEKVIESGITNIEMDDSSNKQSVHSNGHINKGFNDVMLNGTTANKENLAANRTSDIFTIEQCHQKEKDDHESKTVLREKNAFKISKKRKTIVYAVAVFLNMTSLSFLYGLPVVYVEVIDDLKVSRAQGALMMSVSRAVIFGTGFIASWLYHLIGPVKCVVLGGLLSGIGLVVSGFAEHILLIILPLGILTGTGGSLLSMACLNAVVLTFGRRKSLALAFTSIGSGIGSFIFPFVFESFIKLYDWRVSFFIYSGIISTSFIAAFILKLTLPENVRNARKKAGNSFDVKVFKIREYDVYLFVNFLYGVFGNVSNLFIVDVAEGLGYSRQTGAGLASVIGISSLTGRFLYGLGREWIGFFALYGLPPAYIITCSTMIMLSLFDNYWLLFMTCIINGLALGVFAACSSLVPHDLVGTNLFATGMGLVNTVYGVGNAICGPLGGFIKDITGSYNWMFYIGAGGTLLSALLNLLIVYLRSRHKKHSYTIQNSVL